MVKKEVMEACKQWVQARMSEVKQEIAKLEEAAANETKSSMGDKYETGREMIMQEKVKLSERLQLLGNQQIALNALDETLHTQIKAGSLVVTSQAAFFIASAIGAVTVKGEQVFVISQIAPIAKEMMGKKVGDHILFNGKQQEVTNVC